jgi:predicted HicB family RNase H-like nuclease
MGALSIRLPDSLHDKIRKLADAEGISMNQFVMLAVAEKVTRLDVDAQFTYLEVLEALGEAYAKEHDLSLNEAARAVLEKAGQKEPLPDDRIPAELDR